MQLTPADISLLLQALNSHEGVIAGDYERSRKTGSAALTASLSHELGEIRDLCQRLFDIRDLAQQLPAKT